MNVKSITLFGKEVKYYEDGDCWIPIGSRNSANRHNFAFRVEGKVTNNSHLASTYQHHGPRPEGAMALHDDEVCKCGSCINPAHLRWGTRKENVSKNHYKGGRKLTEEAVIGVYLLAWSGMRAVDIVAMVEEAYGIKMARNHVSQIKKGYRWSKVTGQEYNPRSICA